MTKRALIIVDVQNDFCEGGSLAVEGGSAVAAAITQYVEEHGDVYDVIVATQDWHQDPGDHFADEPDYQDSWPHHCVANTTGAEFHPDLQVQIDAVFKKGAFEAAYSGFQGVTIYDLPGGMKQSKRLDRWLQERGVVFVDIVGIAFGHCVKATAIDAVSHGFDTVILKDMTASVAPNNDGADIDEMLEAGVTVLA